MVVFVFVTMCRSMVLVMVMTVTVAMFMFVFMIVVGIVGVSVIMFVRQMHIELHSLNGGLVLARDVEVIAIELELAEFVFQLVRVHAQIDQRANEHVAADAAKDVEIKGFHFVPLLSVIFLIILIQEAILQRDLDYDQD